MAPQYQKESAQTIRFPLGGIGTGCIELDGTGRLTDWEIFGRPNKSGHNGLSHFAIKAENAPGTQVLDARLLCGDLQSPFIGEVGNTLYRGYGFGPDSSFLGGMPHFEECVFEDHFPFGTLHFQDAHFPGKAALTTFNPMIPLDVENSSLPAAFFEVHITNNTSQPVRYTVCLSVTNPAPSGQTWNQAIDENGCHLVELKDRRQDAGITEMDVGEVVIASVQPECGSENGGNVQEYWYRGHWFDSLNMFWHDFTKPGPLVPRQYHQPYHRMDSASVSSWTLLSPGQEAQLKFIITWRYPHMCNYWTKLEPQDNVGWYYESAAEDQKHHSSPWWKHDYAVRFSSAADAAHYCVNNWDSLKEKTQLFSQALWETTLPQGMIQATADNLAILKSPTCLRLEDGSFYAFEGCHSHCGSCEGSCTHVWNYAYALAFLFPQLERSMRQLDYHYCMDQYGGMHFRLQLPLEEGKLSDHRPCVDGQMGGIIKTYRDWKISGDLDWLRALWPKVKRSMEYAWSPDNPDRWDPDRSGIITGRQHNTLDLEFFGPNSWLTGFYLAALQASALMADALGDSDFADLCRTICAKGSKWAAENLFNGEYFIQKISLDDPSILKGYSLFRGKADDDPARIYWNQETHEVKYQLGDGCAIDQVVADWHARICGLEPVFDPNQTRSALTAVFRHNHRSSMRQWPNPCRVYALNDEGGTVLCSWPEGARRPAVPALYSEEVWSGCEYQFAAHLLLMGLTEPAEQVVNAVRKRYDGRARNPFSEMECGSSYARALSSYTLLLAATGFSFDAVTASMGFAPRYPLPLRSFWCFGTAWGRVSITEEQLILQVYDGNLKLARLCLPKGFLACDIVQGAASLRWNQQEDTVFFDHTLQLSCGESIVITMEKEEV